MNPRYAKYYPSTRKFRKAHFVKSSMTPREYAVLLADNRLVIINFELITSKSQLSKLIDDLKGNSDLSFWFDSSVLSTAENYPTHEDEVRLKKMCRSLGDLSIQSKK